MFWLIWPIDAGVMFFLALSSNPSFLSIAFAISGTLSVLIAQKTLPETIGQIFREAP